MVLGGGFAGLESAFTLRAALGERVELTRVSDRHDFLYKPNTIYIPFGADPVSFLIPLAKPAGRRDIALAPGRVEGVDPDSRTVGVAGRKLA